MNRLDEVFSKKGIKTLNEKTITTITINNGIPSRNILMSMKKLTITDEARLAGIVKRTRSLTLQQEDGLASAVRFYGNPFARCCSVSFRRHRKDKKNTDNRSTLVAHTSA